MIKKQLMLTALVFTSISASADGWDFEAGLERQRFRTVASTFTALAVTGGYRYDFEDDLSGTFEASVAFGMGNEEFGATTVKPGTAISAGYRLTRRIEGDWSLFARALFTKTSGESNLEDIELNLDESGLGFGVGAMYRGFVVGGTFYTGTLSKYAVGHIGYRWSL